MPAYVVLDIDVSDPKRYETYKRLGEQALAQHGGRFLVRGSPIEILEESWSPKRMVILEFPDRAAARRWYDSPEYRHAREARKGAATFRAILVDGPPGKAGPAPPPGRS